MREMWNKRNRLEKIKADSLIVPIYINEKTVLDMLAILEDGFSMVSQVNYTEHTENKTSQKAEASINTSASILSKLLKINIAGEVAHDGNKEKDNSVEKEKVHTNVSLLSKFRSYLVSEGIMKTGFSLDDVEIGDFVELEGELQKNPLINYLDIFLDLFRLADIFSEKPSLGDKTKAKNQKQQDSEIVKKIQALAGELKHSGTIDFVLSDSKCTAVLSAQEQYLTNDNISEIIGGRFKVLGKVISVCRDEDESIDLLRKTTLSFFSEAYICEILSGFKNIDLSQLNLPELKTKITGPAIMVIPIAIYA